MWRPFASDFVGHTYNDFRRKMDKIWSAKPAAKREQPQKFDIDSLFPYKFAEDEITQRKNEYANLQSKVDQQRKLIKQRDLEKQLIEKQKAENLNRESVKSKDEMKKSMMRIRSMATNKIHRFKPSRSMEYTDHTFQLTSLTKNAFRKKDSIMKKKNTIK